ncbi:MAG: hypothetical protein ACSLE6_05120 [Mycobacterium sp.]
MSWLLALSIPGLLMLATFGLGRLESALNRDTVSVADIDDFLARACPDDVGTLARDGMSEALECLQKRTSTRPALETLVVVSVDEPGLPTRSVLDIGPNPEFLPTRHADRV